jgi:hypothetical protein
LNKNNFFYFSGVDNLNFLNSLSTLNYFSVYKGCFYDNGASISNMIIPSFSFFESNFNYLNIEGKLRRSLRAITSENALISDSDFFELMYIFRKLYILHNFSSMRN